MADATEPQDPPNGQDEDTASPPADAAGRAARPYWTLSDRQLERQRAAAKEIIDLAVRDLGRRPRTVPAVADVEAAARALAPALARTYDEIADTVTDAPATERLRSDPAHRAWHSLLLHVHTGESQRLVEPVEGELRARVSLAQQQFADLTAELGVRSAQSPAERLAETEARHELARREHRILDEFELGSEQRKHGVYLTLSEPAPHVDQPRLTL